MLFQKDTLVSLSKEYSVKGYSFSDFGTGKDTFSATAKINVLLCNRGRANWDFKYIFLY